MKAFHLFFILTILFHSEGISQRVKFIKNPYQAKLRVYITQDLSEAKQWIFRVPNPTDIRKPGDWYIVTNPQLFKEAITLYKVDKKDDADIIVYYVSTRDSAKIITQ